MLRRTISVPLMGREVLSLQHGISRLSALLNYQNVRGKSRWKTSIGRFHEHMTFNKMGNTRPRKPLLIDPKLVKLGEPACSTVPVPATGMIQIQARKFGWSSRPLNPRSFTRFQKLFLSPHNSPVTVMNSCISCLHSSEDKTSLLRRDLSDAKVKSEMPTTMTMTPVMGGKPPPKNPKKRAKGKGSTPRKTVMDEYGYNYEEPEVSFPITAYALCDEFDLKQLRKGLLTQGLYIPTVLSDDLSDVIHVSAKYPIGDESREIFFFREGAVVFWNVSYLERVNVLKFLKEYQFDSYDEEEVEEECEYMRYIYSDQGSTRLLRGKVILGEDSTNQVLEKYTFANALASSVKLGMWEATLEKYVEGIERITEALKRAEEIKLSRGEVLQKTGELFALRHQLNLNSDLLDTPDFYWERERLETLYQKTCDYLSINRRTKVMNEKLTQCCELLDLISSHLTDQHHTRLEWMIIVLIMIEVGFEILHLLERYEVIHV